MPKRLPKTPKARPSLALFEEIKKADGWETWSNWGRGRRRMTESDRHLEMGMAGWHDGKASHGMPRPCKKVQYVACIINVCD